MTAAIAVAGLQKRFGEVQAVRGVDLEVAAGTVFALLGPNGAGKTTTVEILEGFLDRDGGEVEVLGLDPARERRTLLERIGIVLQETAVEQFLTVRETLARRAVLYPHPRRPDDVIETIGLEEKAGARVRSLSGGQQRRLDLGLGLIGDPEVLFLDEPTTGFDPNARREAWEVVKRLASEGRTVLLTTHYMDEAQALSDHVAVIARGQIVATGTPNSIGGRSTGATTVRFLLPEGLHGLGELPLPATGLSPALADSPDGLLVEISTTAPTGLLQAITSWAVERGVELERLEVTRPSLEDVYLEITSDDSAGGER
ncbi:MAG TPA: ABC transporter ATP-binding protein [Acidimicrobiales bacterium]|nr:ABC transporter ATP-binding protein [Acidimicrobiales bacterium]